MIRVVNRSHDTKNFINRMKAYSEIKILNLDLENWRENFIQIFSPFFEPGLIQISRLIYLGSVSQNTILATFSNAAQ